MSYQLKFIRKPDYLHAIVTGPNTKETVELYVNEVIRECLALKYARVLIEERLEGPRLNALDVFSIVEEGSSRFYGKLKAIAYVDLNAEGSLMQFAENVAVNRAFPLKVLETVEDAEQWLTLNARAGTDSSGT